MLLESVLESEWGKEDWAEGKTELWSIVINAVVSGKGSSRVVPYWSKEPGFYTHISNNLWMQVAPAEDMWPWSKQLLQPKGKAWEVTQLAASSRRHSWHLGEQLPPSWREDLDRTRTQQHALYLQNLGKVFILPSPTFEWLESDTWMPTGLSLIFIVFDASLSLWTVTCSLLHMVKDCFQQAPI